MEGGPPAIVIVSGDDSARVNLFLPAKGSQFHCPIDCFSLSNQFHLLSDIVRCEFVICVQVNEPFATTECSELITRGVLTPVWLPVNSDLSREVLNQFMTAIRRTVVQDDHLLLRPSLVEGATDGIGKPRSAIVNGNKDADEWCSHCQNLKYLRTESRNILGISFKTLRKPIADALRCSRFSKYKVGCTTDTGLRRGTSCSNCKSGKAASAVGFANNSIF